MLRRTLAIGIMFAAVCVPTAEAGPIHYTITFAVGTSGMTLPTAGSFNYDPLSPQFTDFFVVFDEVTFDLTASANSPYIAGTPALPGPGARATFEMLSGFPSTPGGAWDVYWWGGWTAIYSYGGFDFYASRGPVDANERVGVGTSIGTKPDPVMWGPYDVASGSWSIEAQGIPVPDPGSSLLLFGIGLTGLRALRKRLA
jgi:hypothetical protein